MNKVLSTKKLKHNQRDLLLGRGFSVVDYDAIQIDFLDIEIPSTIKNAIFTSQNGVFSIQNSELRAQHYYCVGKKTAALLIKNGQKVIKIAQNGAELGAYIAKNYQNETFHYFCSSIRSEELPQRIKASENELIELKTYKNTPNYKKFDQKWDGILFFSPSGVESFCAQNKIENAVAICIGETTANAVKQFTNNVVVANSTSIESVISKAVKSIKNK